jgi:beta-galactosidase
LTSLGASIHPVWHFNDLKRPDYPFGVSLVCNMVGAAAGDKPFWVTELQGGHNLYTGSQPVNPTTKEINAWLWTSIASGAEKTIFWCLNPRSQGGEAGEWAMLDNKNEPSHRLIEAGKIAAEVEVNKDFFDKASVVKDNIIIAISPETMFLQERNGKGQNQIARQQKAHFLSVLGCYKALKMKGYQPILEFIDHIDWTSKSAIQRMVIVPHATSLTDKQLIGMKDFCNLGNTLLLSGLPGMFNENENYRWSENSAFESITGTKVLEIFTPENEGSFFLPYETFRTKTEVISAKQNAKGYFENQLGKGKCIFVPAMTDLKYWLESGEKSYPNFMNEMAKPFKNPLQAEMKSDIPGSYLQSLSNGSKVLTLVHLPATEKGTKVQFERKGEKLLKILSGKGIRSTSGSLAFEIEAGETFVIMSEKAILPAKP